MQYLTIISDQFQVFPPAPYPECQPSQNALEQNSLEYLTFLAKLEVNSIQRILELNGLLLHHFVLCTNGNNVYIFFLNVPHA